MKIMKRFLSSKNFCRIFFSLMLFLTTAIFLFSPAKIYALDSAGASSISSQREKPQAATHKEASSPPLSPEASENWWAKVQEGIRQSEYHLSRQKETYLPQIKDAWQAANRAHNLRTYFTPDGFRVIPRNTTKPEWSWGLCLRGYGYKGNIQPVAPATLSPSKNRIEYRRAYSEKSLELVPAANSGMETQSKQTAQPAQPPQSAQTTKSTQTALTALPALAALTEWYVNDERGLEQGFTLHAAPKTQKADSSSWIVLRMELAGNLRSTLNKAGNNVDFTTPGGVRVM